MAQTQFTALANGQEVAYRWLSQSAGPTFVHVPGGMVPIEVLEDDPPYERFLRALGDYGSLVVYDFVGKGASDPFDPDVDFVDQNADCFAAVVTACGVEAAWLVVSGVAGAPLAHRAATRHPGLLSGAAVLNPPGPPGDGRVLDVETLLARDDSSNLTVLQTRAPSRVRDPAFRAWHERAGRLGGAAAAGRALYEASLRSTPRVIKAVDEIVEPRPFLILRRRKAVDSLVLDWWTARFPGSDVITLEGADHDFNSADSVVIADTIGAFVTGEQRRSIDDRLLLALLFVDLAASTTGVARLGDLAWAAALDSYEHVVEDVVGRHGGSVVKHLGDGTLATFRTGMHAVGAAASIRRELVDLQLDAYFGVHVGEVEVRGDDIGGIAVHLAARAMSAAEPGQILLTSTALQSIEGGRRRFVTVGVRELKGLDQPRELFALVDDTT